MIRIFIFSLKPEKELFSQSFILINQQNPNSQIYLLIIYYLFAWIGPANTNNNTHANISLFGIFLKMPHFIIWRLRWLNFDLLKLFSILRFTPFLIKGTGQRYPLTRDLILWGFLFEIMANESPGIRYLFSILIGIIRALLLIRLFTIYVPWIWFIHQWDSLGCSRWDNLAPARFWDGKDWNHQ